MNPNKTDLRTLLDDVLPSSGGHCGPARANVLEMVRHQRSRRHRRRIILSTTGVLALVGLLFIWQRPVFEQPPPFASTPKPEPIIVAHVNDEQLFALLQGTPAALLEWPNGERTLLVVEDLGR